MASAQTSISEIPARREAIREALALRAGRDQGTGAIAEATRAAWDEMAERLEPLIGERGVDALLGRSLRLTNEAFPWLALDADQVDRARALAVFGARLERGEPALAVEASSTLLVTFTDLLAGLIGEPLTERLLGAVWAPPPAQRESRP